MPSHPRHRAGRLTHLSVVRDDDDNAGHAVRHDLRPMSTDLESIAQTTVNRVAMYLQITGTDVSAAVVALRQAAEDAGRAGQWGEIVDDVRTLFAELGLQGADELSPAFLASAHRDLVGTDLFTAEHYDALTRPWRTHVGRIHPEDKSLKPGEPAVFGCR